MKPNAFVLLVFALVLAAASGDLFAQSSHDLADGLYSDLQLWNFRGLIADLPPLRPYPLQLITVLLEQVRHRGDQQDQAKAERYLGKLVGTASIDPVASAEARSDLADVYQEYQLGIDFGGAVRPDLTFGGHMGAVISNGQVDAVLPKYQHSSTDVVYDGSVAPLGTSGLTPRVSTDGTAAFGTEELYLQGGLNRVSYGAFWGDSIVLSSDAPQAGTLSLVVRQPWFTYTSLFMDISAVNVDGTGGPYAEKFLSLHSLETTPFPWVTLGLFESVVWGNRFQPIYLLPFPGDPILRSGPLRLSRQLLCRRIRIATAALQHCGRCHALRR